VPSVQQGRPSAIGPIALLGLMSVATPLHGQFADPEIVRHLNAAREAAGAEHGSLFNLLCPVPPGTDRADWALPASPAGLPSIPGEEPWRTAPVRVFDNLFYVGQTEFSAWAITTPEGIIVIDALYDYSVEAQIADGLRTLGLDPADIRYVVISHGHSDHVGGAAFLQDFGARIVMSEADWDLVERSGASWPKPTRDIVAGDGHVIRLGDVTVTLHLTPGHTPGTLSTIISPVRDGDRTHVAAAWGGTAFNFQGSAEFPRDYWLRTYGESAARFQGGARTAGADILLANHPRFDGTPLKIPALADRVPGEAHPYVVGGESIERYLAVAEECAIATRLAEDPR
jgi:metallo-beta-lactamase class B